MLKNRKVSICSWALVVLIGNLNAQYIHSFDSFQNKYTEGTKTYLLNTDQFNFSQGIDAINDLIESGLSSQNEDSFDSLQKSTVSSFQNAFPKEDDFDLLGDFRLSSSEQLTSAKYNHENIPLSLNASGKNPLIMNSQIPTQKENLSSHTPASMAFDSEFNPVFPTGLSSLSISYFPSINPLWGHLLTLSDHENSSSGDFFNFSLTDTFKSNIIGDIARYGFSEVSESLSSHSNLSQKTHSSRNWHHFKSQINERDMLIENRNFFVPESLFKRYPVFSFNKEEPKLIFNIFEKNSLISLDSENLQAYENHPVRTPRYRRASYTFEWEMADFNRTGSDNDYFNFPVNTFSSDDTITIRIKPIVGGNANRDGNGTALNLSATEGLNTPQYILDGLTYSYDSGTGVQTGISPEIWKNAVPGEDWDREWELMEISGIRPNIDNIFIDASAMQYYMNWYYGDWGLEYVGPNYKLIYYSAVPEPSTYFMTGILLCLIGCSRQSRQSIKLLWLKALPNQSEKENISKIKNRLS